ncbi:MAG: L,D-transpeptidase [Alphaproteobacteria bacterium]
MFRRSQLPPRDPFGRILVADNKADEEYLEFDGTELRHKRNDIVVDKWRGISGRPGYQTPEYQNQKDKGPIPEGEWVVKQSRYQYIKDLTTWERIKSATPWTGTWRGLETSWGEDRIELESMPNANARGRSGFFIHGGSLPGSAGCIDLTNEMPKFADKFKKSGKDLTLKVRYPKK